MSHTESIKVESAGDPGLELPANRYGPIAPATAELAAVVEARVQAILDAHANNLIEGADVGAEWLAMLLMLARKSISNEEFTLLAKKAIRDL